MPGLLSFHAHPDDESIATGGTLARYAANGERVVVVTATDGALGEIHNHDNPDAIRPRLAQVRADEVMTALEILGVGHHEFLGYRDSGMMGWEDNLHPDCLWQADFLEATGRLVHLFRKHQPEIVTIYDPFGGYGHPDHIQVHRIGLAAYHAASDLSLFPLRGDDQPWQPERLWMSVWARSRMAAWADIDETAGDIDAEQAARLRRSGFPDEKVNVWMDVEDLVEVKIAAIAAHRTQIPPDWSLINVPDAYKPMLLGHEAFVELYPLPGTTEGGRFELSSDRSKV
jgi:N-acetyl-1-D-myo-inositol-2-amino-2-deoxy-alpha-D-glucopyranoside deacetylase